MQKEIEIGIVTLTEITEATAYSMDWMKEAVSRLERKKFIQRKKIYSTYKYTLVYIPWWKRELKGAEMAAYDYLLSKKEKNVVSSPPAKTL